MKKVITTLILCVSLSCATAVADAILYSQQPWLGEAGHEFSITSQSQINIGDDYSAVVFDNWQVNEDVSITGIRWWGAEYEEADNITFHIVIHDSVDNKPGDLVAVWEFDISEVNETYYGTATTSTDLYHTGASTYSTARDLTINQYSVALPDAFVPTASEEYWIGIYAEVDGAGFWGWSDYISQYPGPFDGDAIKILDYNPATGTYSLYEECDIWHTPCGWAGTADTAFELTGVPEPGTIVMIIAGLATLVGTIKARS